MKRIVFVLITVLLICCLGNTLVAAETENQLEKIIDNFFYAYENIELEDETKELVGLVLSYVKEHENYSKTELDALIKNNSVGNSNRENPENRDYNYYLTTTFAGLNSQEVALYNSNPTYGLSVLVQAATANNKEKVLYGSNSCGTNGDAFRHSCWNALGAHFTSQTYMADFARAHEEGASGYNPNSLDTAMDNHNNAKGRTIVAGLSLPSTGPNIVTVITTSIAANVQNGNMKRYVSGGVYYSYLIRTNSSSSN